MSATRTWGVCRSNKWNITCDHSLNNVDSYLTPTKKTIDTLKPAKTPFLDESKVENSSENEEGMLAPVACKVLMKIRYGARLARFDLLRPIAALASKIIKWDTVCDRMLHRLVCYINSPLGYKLEGHIGDSSKYVNLTLFSDADFAGCLDTAKSTSGVLIALTGPNSFFPLNAVSKKQACVSHSTPEAEIVAADLEIRTEGLPALQFRMGYGVREAYETSVPRRTKLLSKSLRPKRILH